MVSSVGGSVVVVVVSGVGGGTYFSSNLLALLEVQAPSVNPFFNIQSVAARIYGQKERKILRETNNRVEMMNHTE